MNCSNTDSEHTHTADCYQKYLVVSGWGDGIDYNSLLATITGGTWSSDGTYTYTSGNISTFTDKYPNLAKYFYTYTYSEATEEGTYTDCKIKWNNRAWTVNGESDNTASAFQTLISGIEDDSEAARELAELLEACLTTNCITSTNGALSSFESDGYYLFVAKDGSRRSLLRVVDYQESDNDDEILGYIVTKQSDPTVTK